MGLRACVESLGSLGRSFVMDRAPSGQEELPRLKRAVFVVEWQWLTDSILAGRRRPEGDYAPAFAAALQRIDKTAGATTKEVGKVEKDSLKVAAEEGPASQPAASSSIREATDQPVGAHSQASTAERPAKRSRQSVDPNPHLCRVLRQGSDFVAADGHTLPEYTGGDTGIPWGWAGVWQEPWDPATAE